MLLTRRLTVLAQDPSVRVQGRALTAQLTLPHERLDPGPRGARIHVVDYETESGRVLRPVVLGDDDAFAGEPATKLVASPQFHAQHAYAWVMVTLGRFERALGRRVAWGFRERGLGPHQLEIVPHAFCDANAFYSRDDEALMFGWFRDERGEPVHTCLSPDIVVHETTHAVLDGVRPDFLWPSSPDQAAFHEGYSDLIALLSTLAQPELLAALLKREGGDPLTTRALTASALRRSTVFALAEDMGEGELAGRSRALRESLRLKPGASWRNDRDFEEPHRRGEILVAAVLGAYVEVWAARLRRSRLEAGSSALACSLVARVGATLAEVLLDLMIRALDYLPPNDLVFGDFVSAVLTADARLFPADAKYGLRPALLTSFESFALKPTSREPDGTWQRADAPPANAQWRRREPEPPRFERASCHLEALRHDREEVFRFVWENREALHVHPLAVIRITSVRDCHRRGDDGVTVHETVIEYRESLELYAKELKKLGLSAPEGADPRLQITLHGGGTLVLGEYGDVLFHVKNRLDSAKQQGRLDYLAERGLLGAPRSAAPTVREVHLARVRR